MPDQHTPVQFNLVVLAIHAARKRPVVPVRSYHHAPDKAGSRHAVEERVSVIHVLFDNMPLFKHAQRQAVPFRIPVTVFDQKIFGVRNEHARRLGSIRERNGAKPDGLRAVPGNIHRIRPPQKILRPCHGLGREKPAVCKNSLRIHQAERPDGALPALRIEQVRYAQEIEKTGRQQTIDGEFKQIPLPAKGIRAGTGFSARNDHGVIDRKPVKRRPPGAEPVQRFRIEKDRRQIFRCSVQRGAGQLRIPSHTGMKQDKRRTPRRKSTHIEVDVRFCERPGVMHQTRQFRPLGVAIGVEPRWRIGAHRHGKLHRTGHKVRAHYRFAIGNARHVIFQKSKMRLEVGGVMGQRIDQRLDSLIRIACERTVAGRKTGRVRLELDTERHHVISRRRRLAERSGIHLRMPRRKPPDCRPGKCRQ